MIFSEHSIGTSSLRLKQKQIIPQYLSSVLNRFFQNYDVLHTWSNTRQLNVIRQWRQAAIWQQLLLLVIMIGKKSHVSIITAQLEFSAPDMQERAEKGYTICRKFISQNM